MLDLTFQGGGANGVGGVAVAGVEERDVDALVSSSIGVFQKSCRMDLTFQGGDVPPTGLAVLLSLVSRSTMSMSSSTVPSVFSEDL